MKLFLTKFLVISFIASIQYSTVISQRLSPDTSASIAVKNTINYYNTVLAEQMQLYSGKEYLDYPRPFLEGHPYFLNTGWNKGTVNYGGSDYDDVSLKYDLISDDVVILAFNKVSKIRLLKDNVAGFSLSGHSFVKMTRDSLLQPNMTEGYYDVLTEGKIKLLARRTKNIQSFVKQTVESRVFEKDHFYLKKNGTYHNVDSKSSFLELVGDKKKEIQQYIKQNRLKFRKASESTMIKVAMYYNQLTA